MAAVLSKHLKYKDSYIPNDIFWGLGLEHETYLEAGSEVAFTLGDMLTKTKAERYSVRYFENYKADMYEKAMLDMYKDHHVFLLPRLWNSYGLQNCDLSGNHKTLYEKATRRNPEFTGASVWEILKSKDIWFATHYEKEFLFDGDTVEFTTLNFYKTTIESVLEEYSKIEAGWQKRVQNCLGDGVTLMKTNYPFVSYTSNPENVAMFNNGTLHINITLPTKLNEKGRIQDWDSFVSQHKCLARAIQWLEPFWVAIYGSPDPLSKSARFGNRFSKASQRCAVSRYIGIGTYDTSTMPRGKILQIPSGDTKFSWIPSQREETGYSKREYVGLDLNFNKHWNHGLELRWFDQMSVLGIREVLRSLVGLGDFSLDVGKLPDPQFSTVWRRVTGEILMRGVDYTFDEADVLHWLTIFQCPPEKKAMSVTELYETIVGHLSRKYQGGMCGRHFCREELKSSEVISPVEVVSVPKKWCCI